MAGRFALACNSSEKIIEPIQSRCAIVRYSKISDQDVLSRLLVVADPWSMTSGGVGAGLAQLGHAELYSRLFRS